MEIKLVGSYIGAWLQVDCMNEDHAVKVLESAGLLNPLLFDPVQDTRLLMQRLDGENRFKEKLDRAFYYEVHL